MFVRVLDPGTGHQFDVSENDPRIGDTLQRVDGYEPSRLPRPPKPYTDKAGKPATRKRAASSAATNPTEPAVSTEKE